MTPAFATRFRRDVSAARQESRSGETEQATTGRRADEGTRESIEGGSVHD
jgi:hypothetical protein